MRMRTSSKLLVQIAGMALAAGAQAFAAEGGYGAKNTDAPTTVITMPSHDTAPAATNGHRVPTSIDRPPRGMNMQRVVAQYGEPVTRHAAVGQPPIARWDYPGYRLYFEYNHVLHAVVAGDPEPVAHTDELARQAR